MEKTGQIRYAMLATKLGDLMVKYWGIEAQIAAVRIELEALDKEIGNEDK